MIYHWTLSDCYFLNCRSNCFCFSLGHSGLDSNMVFTRKGGLLNASADGKVVRADFQLGKRGSKKSEKQLSTSPIKLLVCDADKNHPCKVCENVVTDDPKTEAVQCDRCEAWLHFSCSKLRKIDYDYLTNNPQSSVNWFCEPCRKDMKSGPAGQDSRILQHGAKMDTVMGVIKGMQAQMAVMQGQMAMMMDTTNKKKDEEKESENVQAQVTEAIEEQKEKEEKKNNVIVFNIPEPTSEDNNEAMKEDIKLVKDMLAVVHPNIDNVEIDESNTKRLGFKKKDHTRPIKVQFKDDSIKGQVFRNSSKLKSHDKFSKVNISNDKTRRELQADKKLKEQLMAERALRPDDDLIIYRGDIIKRVDRPARVQH